MGQMSSWRRTWGWWLVKVGRKLVDSGESRRFEFKTKEKFQEDWREWLIVKRKEWQDWFVSWRRVSKMRLIIQKRSVNASSESDEKLRDGKEDSTTYNNCIPLVVWCPGTVTTHTFHQVSPTLDESSRTVFALGFNGDNFQLQNRLVHCVPSSKCGEIEWHDSLRLKQVFLSLYALGQVDWALWLYDGWYKTLFEIWCLYFRAGPELFYDNSIQLQFIVRHRWCCCDWTSLHDPDCSKDQRESTGAVHQQGDWCPVVKIVQIPRVHFMMKTNEIRSCSIDESMNDSGVRDFQVLIVEQTVEGSQLQWDMCS